MSEGSSKGKRVETSFSYNLKAPQNIWNKGMEEGCWSREIEQKTLVCIKIQHDSCQSNGTHIGYKILFNHLIGAVGYDILFKHLTGALGYHTFFK